MKQFDLNIEKILENWEAFHAIREIIANALDEQLITNTKEVEILKKNSYWVIRDYGRGLKYTNLTQNENQEKLQNPKVIGKFGIGLKDALATFDRKGIKVQIKSKHGDITLTKTSKDGFEDIITLHACIAEPTDPNLIGTEVIIDSVTDDEILKAKNLFLRFSGESVIESTKAGDIVKKTGTLGKIYINGVKVAEEEKFLFNYNITQLTAAIKKSLNRERTNVGRTAYTDSIKKILLSCQSSEVAKLLASDLQNINYGTQHDELNWIDVQEHAVKILNKTEKVVFVSSSDLIAHPNMIDEAQKSGHQIISIPENLKEKIKGGTDFSGNPIIDINQFVTNYNDSFKFEFVSIQDLSVDEKNVYDQTEDILNLINGKPQIVKEIIFSKTMRKDFYSETETQGIWDPSTRSIIILRKMLRSVRDYAGTLVHEAIHAKSGAGDVNRQFETELTTAIGQISEKALDKKKKWWQ
jgi:hypothetical protein